MNKIIFGMLASVCIALLGCAATGSHGPSLPGLTDPHATAETRALYRNLLMLQGEQVLFGHQDSLAYGVSWMADSDRSDVKDVTGSFPAVYGWDIGWLEKDSAENLDGVRFEFMREAKLSARGRDHPELAHAQPGLGWVAQ